MGKDYLSPETEPKLLLMFSGKRKCGKDFLTDILIKRLNDEKIDHAVMRISAPIKHFWAQKHSLEYEKLLDASAYKEDHRGGMVKWSMEVRAENYGYFPFEAIKMANAEGKSIWICVDIRHRRDYDWFQQYYSHVMKRVRIQTDESVRKERGWVWTDTIDNAPTECDLDSVADWDLVVDNNGSTEESVKPAVESIMSWIYKALEQ